MVLVVQISRGDVMFYVAKEINLISKSFPDNIQKDLNCYILKSMVTADDTLLLNLYFDKRNLPILFICNLKKEYKTDIKNIRVYGLFGDYTEENDYFEMELSLKLNCTGCPIEIIKISSGKEKRTGRGSLGINFLEEHLIPKLNTILNAANEDVNISYIYGISADLSDDTNALGRAKFYCRNDFIYSNAHFYKYINYHIKDKKTS